MREVQRWSVTMQATIGLLILAAFTAIGWAGADRTWERFGPPGPYVSSAVVVLVDEIPAEKAEQVIDALAEDTRTAAVIERQTLVVKRWGASVEETEKSLADLMKRVQATLSEWFGVQITYRAGTMLPATES